MSRKTTERKTRNCLRCRRSFMSESAGNRLCETCGKQNAFVSKRMAVAPLAVPQDAATKDEDGGRH